MADDSGLEVDALDGAPGIFSARYAGENASDQQNIEKLLREDASRPTKRRRGSAASSPWPKMGNCWLPSPAKSPGRSSRLRAAKNGFGYDPIFIPEGFDRDVCGITVRDEKRRQSSRESGAPSSFGILILRAG